MTQATMDRLGVTARGAKGLQYRVVWRWHFYAGLFCIPFVLWLSVTGTIFLFHPQIQVWLDRPYDHPARTGAGAAVHEQVRAALAAVPGARLEAYQLPANAESPAEASDAMAGMNMGSHDAGRSGDGAAAVSYGAIDEMVATVAPLALTAPVLVSPPKRAGEDWTAKSDTRDRPRRGDLVLDGRTGAVLSRKDFSQKRWLDRVIGTGIAAHEGQLFGLANQLLGLMTTCGLVTLSVSGLVM